MGYIYCITNDINGKKYIGQTADNIEERFKEHLSSINAKRDYDRPLYRAMRKYGIEHFHISLIEECSTESLDTQEEFWIQYFDTYKNGYNATLGGQGNKGYDRQAIWEYYCQCNKIAQTARHFHCDRRVVRSIIRAHGIYNPHGEIRSIYQLSKEDGSIIQEFVSIAEAARYFHKAKSGLREALITPYKTYCGYFWCYVDNYTETRYQEVILPALEEAKIKKSNHLSDKAIKVSIEEIAEYYLQCEDIHKTAKHFGYTSTATIVNRLKKIGIERTEKDIEQSKQRSIKNLTEAKKVFSTKYDYQRIVEVYLARQSIIKTANEIGCSTQTVVKALKTQDITPVTSAEVNQNKVKAVKQYNKNTGELICSYPSASAAARAINKPQGNRNISACCKGKQKTAYGYVWRYCESE